MSQVLPDQKIMLRSLLLLALAMSASAARPLMQRRAASLPLAASAMAPSDTALLLRLRGGEEYELGTQVAAELVGTFVLLLSVRVSGLVPKAWTSPVQCVVLPTLGMLIYLFGSISGALFNPAVNIAAVAAGEMTLARFGIFSGTQLVAAVLATKVVAALSA